MLHLVSQQPFTALAVADIKTHLNISDSSTDAYIQTLLDAAVVYCERYTGMDYRQTTWAFINGQFPIWANYSWGDRWGNYQAVWPMISEFAIGRGLQRWQEILLPRGPLQTLTSIVYYDASNVEQTLGTDQYTYTTETYLPARLEPVQYWPIAYPRPDAVTITYVSGYTTVPPSILHAIKLLCGTWWSLREDINYGPGTAVGATGQAVESLLGQFRPGLYA
jgi:hypothetical protein